ncbi:MAG: NUDIX hydrolase [Candidatus Paceibacterota bacterium]
MTTRNVSVLILYSKGKILLQKRAKTAKRFPCRWGLFGGGIEKKETPKATLKREIMEELGLKLTTPKFFKEYPYILDDVGERGDISVYFHEYSKEKLYLREGEQMKWVSLPEALNLDLHPIYRDIIEDIGKRAGSVLS